MKIDWWTVLLQTINLLVLLWLLERFFWRPLTRMIEARRARLAAAQAEIEDKKRQLDTALAEVERTRAGFAAEREALLESARKEAEAQRTRLLEAAQKEAEEIRRQAREAMAREHADAREAWHRAAAELAVEIARRLLQALDPQAIETAFLEPLFTHLDTLPPETRRLLAAAPSLQILSAAPLSETAKRRCRERLGQSLGAVPEVQFRVDATLIAGIELHAPNVAIRHSWQAELERLREELRDAAP